MQLEEVTEGNWLSLEMCPSASLCNPQMSTHSTISYQANNAKQKSQLGSVDPSDSLTPWAPSVSAEGQREPPLDNMGHPQAHFEGPHHSGFFL